MHVDQREFPMLGGRGQAEYPPTHSHFVAYKLSGRRIRARENINGAGGIFLGANASVEFTNHLQNPKCMPPALRKSSPREVLGFLRASGQFGFPAPVRTDA